MIVKIATHIAHVWVSSGVISKEYEENYVYGVQLLLSSVFNLVFIVLISILFQAPVAWIPFMLAFAPLRLSAGGFHAKTHRTCIGLFCAVFAGVLFLSRVLPVTAYGICSVTVAFSSLCTVFRLSPVAAINKPLTEPQALKYRRYSIMLALLFLIPAVLIQSGIIAKHPIYIHFYAGELCSAVSLVAAKVTTGNASP